MEIVFIDLSALWSVCLVVVWRYNHQPISSIIIKRVCELYLMDTAANFVNLVDSIGERHPPKILNVHM